MKNNHHFLSVIIPTYRQSRTIISNLRQVHHALSQIRYNFEIILVVDGTATDETFTRAKSLKLPGLKIVGYKHNRGKGYAVRFGMKKARGDYIAFIDSGMEIDPNGISLLIEHLEWYQADIIVASKRHPASYVNYPIKRRVISLCAQVFARVLLGINVRDTQAGLKIFRREVLQKVLPRLLVKHFAFDLEILSVASRLGFHRIYEAPIKLSFDASHTTINSRYFRVILRSFIDALAVFYRLRVIRYYDDNYTRHKVYDRNLQMSVNR